MNILYLLRWSISIDCSDRMVFLAHQIRIRCLSVFQKIQRDLVKGVENSKLTISPEVEILVAEHSPNPCFPSSIVMVPVLNFHIYNLSIM
jgi:hypothetical protein